MGRGDDNGGGTAGYLAAGSASLIPAPGDACDQDSIVTLASTLRNIKRDLMSAKTGAQITEAIPLEPSDMFPIPAGVLEMLHRFASENPIYHDSSKSVLAGVRCATYHGDINRYWLGSILHENSRAPFSPTWIASAYVLARLAREMGYERAFDVGSGDGRIAFCMSLVGMDAHGIEIDADLSKLQQRLSRLSKFETHCTDAVLHDYSELNSADPAIILVGGLAQMGAGRLVSMIVKKIAASEYGMPGWAFAGTKSPKYAPDPTGMYGWGEIMRRTGLHHMRTVELPSAWTADQSDDVQYVFAS